MTSTCSNTTITPFNGEVAWPYWQTLVDVATAQGVTINLAKKCSTNLSGTLVATVEQYLDVFTKGLKVSETFGLQVGKSVTLGTFPVLGMTLLSCQDLRQALSQILRYEALNHDLGVSKLVLGQKNSRYIWIPNELYLPSSRCITSFQLALSVFAGVQVFSPKLIQQTLPLERVGFRVDKPKNATVYNEFFQTDVLFNQACNFIDIKSSILDLAVVGGDMASFSALTSYADSLLADKDKGSVILQLQRVLPRALGKHQFKVDDLASELNISVRTLQRQLKDSGTKFQRVLDSVRQQLAEHYLLEKKLSMSDIAFLIGYQEQSSFNHAFKGWSGMSPSEFVSRIGEKS